MTAPTALARRHAGPARHVYDTIVIGGQLGGILTAALLARRGLQVLFVDHDVGATPYQHGDWKFSYAPFLLPSLKSLSLFEDVLGELGMLPTVQRLLQPVALQVLTGDARFELPNDADARAKELKRALGARAEEFETMLQRNLASASSSDAYFATKPELPPEGFFSRWRFRRVLPRFADALETPCPLKQAQMLELASIVTGLEQPPPLSFTRVLGKVVAAPHVVAGGREGLHHAFTERARELGVDVLTNGDTVEALSFEGRKPVGIRLTRNDTVYRAAFIVAACDVSTLAPLVPEARRKPMEKPVAALDAKRAVFTMNVVLPERALPRGLGPLAVGDSPDRELGGLLLQVTPAEVASDRILSLSATVPLALRAGGEPAIKALMQRVWAAVDGVMPFTKQHARFESASWMDAPRVVAGAFEPLPLLPSVEASVLGVSALTLSSPYQRLLFANRQVLPGLGFEGEVLTAVRAAKHIESAVKKNDPLKNRRSAA